MSRVVYKTEVLEARSKNGLPKYWMGQVVEDNNQYFTKTCYWHTKDDGEPSIVQESAPYRVLGKNIGRANETTPKDQAILEISSDCKKQIDKGYASIGEASKVLPLPMLANKYKKGDFGKLVAPVYVGAKIDGCRALLGPKGIFWSRMGKEFIPEVVSHLVVDTKGLILDGEFRLPKKYTFQETMQVIKKARPLSPSLEYHIFDIVDATKKFSERYAILTKFLGGVKNPQIKLVGAIEVTSEDEIFENHTKFCEQGYEGTIIRDDSVNYEIGHRSNSLLKYKLMEDAEYSIVGVTDGLGKEVGCAIFICDIGDGRTFECRPRGTIEDRQKMFKEKSGLIGKLLKVKFQEYTDSGLPRFPVGIEVDRLL